MRHYRIEDQGYPELTVFLRACLDRSGWTSGEPWSLYWSIEPPDDDAIDALDDGRWLNHFPGYQSIVLKDQIHLYVRAAARRLAGREIADWLDFVPRTYSMPDELDEFVRVATEEPERVWLLKPRGSWGGQDIDFLADPGSIRRGEDRIVQEYIGNPLLFPDHPYKHVLRIYLLITSLDPLVAYVHTTGSVRFTSRPYELTPGARPDPVTHFINGYTQKRDPSTPVRTEDLEAYRQRLASVGIGFDTLWGKIRRMLTLTVIAHRERMLSASLRRTPRLDRCFELLGCDVLVDEHAKPWLLECNLSPALGLDAPEGTPDREAQVRSREPVVEDTLHLLGLLGEPEAPNPGGIERFARELERRGGFERVFPAADALDFLPAFQRPRPADLELVRIARGA